MKESTLLLQISCLDLLFSFKLREGPSLPNYIKLVSDNNETYLVILHNFSILLPNSYLLTSGAPANYRKTKEQFGQLKKGCH